MDTPEVLSILMVVVLMALLFSGYPVALVLIAVTMTFTVIGMIVGEMNVEMVRVFPLRIYSLLAESLIFSAIPPLIFMGVALAKSGLAADLFSSVATLLRRVPGGLALTVLLLGILIAPSAGVVGASVGILALAALPTMLEAGYDKPFASGAVAAAGTLGIMLPPAVMLFFLADLVGSPLIAMFVGILLPAARRSVDPARSLGRRPERPGPQAARLPASRKEDFAQRLPPMNTTRPHMVANALRRTSDHEAS